MKLPMRNDGRMSKHKDSWSWRSGRPLLSKGHQQLQYPHTSSPAAEDFEAPLLASPHLLATDGLGIRRHGCAADQRLESCSRRRLTPGLCMTGLAAACLVLGVVLLYPSQASPKAVRGTFQGSSSWPSFMIGDVESLDTIVELLHDGDATNKQLEQASADGSHVASLDVELNHGSLPHDVDVNPPHDHLNGPQSGFGAMDQMDQMAVAAAEAGVVPRAPYIELHLPFVKRRASTAKAAAAAKHTAGAAAKLGRHAGKAASAAAHSSAGGTATALGGAGPATAAAALTHAGVPPAALSSSSAAASGPHGAAAAAHGMNSNPAAAAAAATGPHPHATPHFNGHVMATAASGMSHFLHHIMEVVAAASAMSGDGSVGHPVTKPTTDTSLTDLDELADGDAAGAEDTAHEQHSMRYDDPVVPWAQGGQLPAVPVADATAPPRATADNSRMGQSPLEKGGSTAAASAAAAGSSRKGRPTAGETWQSSTRSSWQ